MAGTQKTAVGRVVSDKMNKTVVVAVERYRLHRLYKRRIKRVSKFHAHDEQNACKLGDTVRIVETRPLSKTKRWRVAEIISHVELAEIQPEEIDEETGG